LPTFDELSKGKSNAKDANVSSECVVPTLS